MNATITEEDLGQWVLDVHRSPLPTGTVTGIGTAMHMGVDESGRYGVHASPAPEHVTPPATLEGIKWVIRSREFRAAALNFPRNDIDARDPQGGRPAKTPDFVHFAVIVLTSMTGSQREAIKFLNTSPDNWRIIRKELRRAFRDFRVPFEPPKRNQLNAFNARLRTPQGQLVLSRIRNTLRAESVSRAQAAGLLAGTPAFSYNHVDLRYWAAIDGTIFPPPGNRKIDTASGLHLKNGTDKVFGSKHNIMSCRGNDPYSRYILDIVHVKGMGKSGIGDEAAVSEPMIRELKATTPGLHGVVVDSAIRGTRVTELAEAGIHILNYPHAQENPNRKRGKRLGEGRVEKSRKIKSATHPRRNGRTCTHDIYVEGGTFCQAIINAEGQQVLSPLSVAKFEKRERVNGVNRYYFQLVITCSHGDFTERVAGWHTGDGEVEFNRGEYVRLYSPSDPRFHVLYGRRNDTESTHNQIKHRMARMRSYSPEGQTVIALGIWVSHNVQTTHLSRMLASHHSRQKAA